jgi:hypothetical protein
MEELDQHGGEHLVGDAVPLPREAPMTAVGQLACDAGGPAGEVVAAALAVEDQSRDLDRAEQAGSGRVRDRAVVARAGRCQLGLNGGAPRPSPSEGLARSRIRAWEPWTMRTQQFSPP